MRVARWVLPVFLTVAFVSTLTPDAQAAEPRTLRVSRHSLGGEGDNNSVSPSISDDGRYVAFTSGAENLVSGDTNSRDDVFVHDLTTGRTTRISRHSLGTQGDGHSQHPSISHDGRFVAFESAAENLVSGDTNGVRDVFVHDRLASTTGSTTLVSRHSAGAYGNNASGRPSISDDGRFVAFHSLATNLASGDTNGFRDVFVHDRLASTTGRTLIVSRHTLGTEANGNSFSPAINGDSQFVAFDSDATNLVSGDTNGSGDVFVNQRY